MRQTPADAYAGFDKLYRSNRIQEVACWAHFRRKIFENHATSPTPLTNNLLDRIAVLYRIEEEIRRQPPDQRRRHRQDRSRPQVNELRSIIDDALRRLSPKSNMAKALSYGRKLKDFKRIAMRACKTDQSFSAMIYLAAAVINSR